MFKARERRPKDVQDFADLRPLPDPRADRLAGAAPVATGRP